MPRGRPRKGVIRTEAEVRELASQRQRKRRAHISQAQYTRSHTQPRPDELPIIEYKPDSHPTITTGPFASFAACLREALPPTEISQLVDDSTCVAAIELNRGSFRNSVLQCPPATHTKTQLTQDSGVDVTHEPTDTNEYEGIDLSFQDIGGNDEPYDEPATDIEALSLPQEEDTNINTQGPDTYIPLSFSSPPPGYLHSGEAMIHGAVAPGDETNHPILLNHGEEGVVSRIPPRIPYGSPSPESPPIYRTHPIQPTQAAPSDTQIDHVSPAPVTQGPEDRTNEPATSHSSQSALATLIARHLTKPASLIGSSGRVGGRYFRGKKLTQYRPRPYTQRLPAKHNRHPNFCLMNGHGYPLRAWLDRVEEGVPYLLGSETLRKGQQLNTTIPQRQKLFSGETFGQFQREEPMQTPLLDFTEGLEPTKLPFEAHFDVDSVIIMAKSIAIAKCGLKVLTIQRALPAITSSLHLGTFPCRYHDTEDPDEVKEANLPIHQIPHFSLGRFAANDDMEMLIVLPHAVRQTQKIAKLTDELYTIWMDEIFLPAVHDTLPPSQSRVFPASHAEAKAKATLKSHTELKNDTARNAYLHYQIQPQYLDELWTRVNVNIRLSGEQRFQDYLIVVNAKGIKGGTSSSTWQGMRQKFHKRVLRHVDTQYKLNAWYDIGKEWTYPLSTLVDHEDDIGQTALWSLKYINELVGYFRCLFPDAPKSGIVQRDYPSYFFAGLGATTIEPDESHPLREHGLIYAQWYNTVKDLFSAGDQYLASNDAQADLGLDPAKIATLKHIAHAVSIDHDRLIASYLHLKHYIHTLHSAQQKSFSIREEYRVRDDLWEALHTAVDWVSKDIDYEWYSEGEDDHREIMGTPPPVPLGHGPIKWSFIPIPTRDFVRWVKFNVNRFCVGIEHIFSTVPESAVITWEQTRAVSMFFTGIGVFIGSLTAGQGVRLWSNRLPKSRKQDPNAVRRQGMGMLKNMMETGYPWFMPKLNWHTLTFKSSLADAMGFDRPAIEQRLWKHSRQIQGVRDLTSRVEGVFPWLCRYGRLTACREIIFRFLFQICAHQLRLDVLAKMKPTIKAQFHDDVDSGSIPLSFDSLSRVLVLGTRGLHIKNRPADWVKTYAQWCDHIYLDKVPPKSQNNAYHLPFLSAKQVIHQAVGADTSKEWQRQYFEYIRATNWLLPYPQNQSFLAPWSDKARGEERPWQVFVVANPEISNALAILGAGSHLPLPKDWLTCYSSGDKWEVHNTPHLRGIPELDVNLIDLTSTELYLRICDLAGSDFRHEDEQDTDEEASEQQQDDLEHTVTLPYYDIYDLLPGEARPPLPRRSARHKRGASSFSCGDPEEEELIYQGNVEDLVGGLNMEADGDESEINGAESEFEGFSTDFDDVSEVEA